MKAPNHLFLSMNDEKTAAFLKPVVGLEKSEIILLSRYEWGIKGICAQY